MRGFKLNIGLGKRIYFAMLAIILVSLILIGGFTIYFFKKQNEEYHLSRLKRKDGQISTGIQYFLDKNDIQKRLDEVPKDLYEKIDELSSVNNIGINIYDLKGQILFAFESTDSLTTNKELEEQIDLEVLGILENKPGVAFIEKISEDHLATYSFIINRSGERIGLLKIPYHDFSTSSIEFYSFFRTLLQVYLFLLVAASMFAYYISKQITNSLKTIGDRMKDVAIDKKNEKIVWESKDEIGDLVNQYNGMIDQLEQSAELLAQSERETAWREMAKQVAHEIKNPLTPMKLNVQFLEQTLKPTTENFNERMKKFSEKMITQIDTLTNIANEFSSFAKMPKTNLGKVDLSILLNVAKETFTNEIKIVFEEPNTTELVIDGDKEQLVRVFNNLFKNAVQAIPSDTKGVIIVSITKESEVLTIEVKDNGKGIPPDEYQNIFVPNFTTKSSGSGLGLAMVKNIMKHHNGLIWFESKVGVGTSFFLSFPYKEN